jgi:ubiquinone/menaquinone biosynthesis C-methylase UbiE
VWSQATIYHVHEKEKALSESYRVLSNDGVLIFDDLIKPRSDISEATKTYVYDRLLFDTDFSFDSYQVALRNAGFSVLDAIDLSPHLKTSYQCLAGFTRAKGDEQHGKYMDLTFAYEQMEQALDKGELGWGLYLCRK